eukprot:TRINITY_DN14912_c0_g1_i1.p1 TRINITY_DN14912_c0_g1~~TRINITY_DN14912_c0_g1_i1.p1  ORF type:complete len:472 (+),score=131.26 TRINITY_DN14912_c0_g1_i1:71-1486(+)
MGNSHKTWHSPEQKTKEGTALKEIKIKHIRDAHEIIGLQVEDYTPVSLVPEHAASNVCGVPCCWVGIPEGFTAMVTKWGADVAGGAEDGTWEPGHHCWWPWYSVSRLVTKQLIIFDSPVKNCKTADDITINIDVLVDCWIRDAKKFMYNIGPEKFDDLMRATEEEVLRSMAGTLHVEDIYDLHGKNTQEWVDKMNTSFERYGVEVRHFTVRHVSIPNDMAKDFEDKTLYDSKTSEKRMQQSSDMLNNDHIEERQKLREQCDNDRMAKEEEVVTIRSQITKEVSEVVANSEREISKLDAETTATVEDITTKSMLECAKIEAQIRALKRESTGKVQLEEGKLNAEAELYEVSKRSEAKAEASEKISEGKKAVAEAEGVAADAFAAKRALEQEEARIRVIGELAQNKHIKIASSLENSTGLAPDNSLVAQVAQQGLEAFRMKLAEMTAASAKKLDMGQTVAGGLVRPVPQVTMK